MTNPPRAAVPFCRNPLVRLTGVKSSYDARHETGTPWPDRIDLEGERTGWGTADLRQALLAAQRAVLEAGGTLGVTECFRSFRSSNTAHRAHPSTVRPGGGSVHNGGQAIDIDVYHLGGLDLATIWDLVIPLGFSPIIRRAVVGSEAWHFDFRGEWRSYYAWAKENIRSRAYDQLARCCCLDAGAWDRGVSGWSKSRMRIAYVQAQYHRLGYHRHGLVDGQEGDGTRRAHEEFWEDEPPPAGLEEMAERFNQITGQNAQRIRRRWEND